MRSKLLFSVASVMCGVMLFSSDANATPVPPGLLHSTGPKWAIDLGRSIEGIIEGVIMLCGDGDAKAELIAKQEAVNSNADGSAGTTSTTTGTTSTTSSGKAGETALTNGVYSYVQSEILSQTNLTQYTVLQNDINSPKAEGDATKLCTNSPSDTTFPGLGYAQGSKANPICIAIVDTFFAAKGDENTHEYQDTVLSQRQDYAQQVAKRHVTLGYNIQQKVIDDLKTAAKAPITSDNEVGAIAIDGQTLDEMLKVTVADLAIQIEMMEADAVAFLLQQPIEIMSKEPPAESQE